MRDVYLRVTAVVDIHASTLANGSIATFLVLSYGESPYAPFYQHTINSVGLGNGGGGAWGGGGNCRRRRRTNNSFACGALSASPGV